MRPKCARACSLMLAEITASVCHPTAGLRGDTARPSPDLRNPPADWRPVDKDERGRRGGEGDRDACASLTGSRPTAVKEELRVPPGCLRPEPVGARPGLQFSSHASRAGLGPPHARFLLAPRARRLVGNGGKGGAARAPTPRAPEGSPPITCWALACSPATPPLRGMGALVLVQAHARWKEREEAGIEILCYPISTPPPPILGNFCETIEGLRCVTQ